jgi:hypothetical protein
MFGQIFGSIGGKIGGFFGGGILKTIGKFAGKYIGNYLERALFRATDHYRSDYGITDDFYNPTAAYGGAIPLIYGSARTGGTLIWSSNVKEVVDSNFTEKFDNYGLKVSDATINQYDYYLTCAIAICEGEISDLGRVWVGNRLIDLANYKYVLYKGTKDQLPNELIEKEIGKGKVPAYRGLAYIIFENLPLADFGNHLPNFSFEVFRRSKEINKEHNSLEKMIKNMIMIPGSGEFVYDTKIQSKIYSEHGVTFASEKINCHNPEKIANALYSLNQLQQYCSDLEWIAPVVTWFCNDLDISKASIYPAVEYKDPHSSTSEEWRVGHFTRTTARLVSRNELDQPNYGGSVNDASVIRYLQEIKSRGLKILFYPMFFMDVPMKPWRGHARGDISVIHSFFNKPDGYNNFILHYANLAAPYVDAFIIGSELIGITTITDNKGNFPAVDELVQLAAKVKQIVGDKVMVTYAADWSEYHHAPGGFYHLDPLWSSKDIDFVGIDAYFPLTETNSSAISEDEIKKGWVSGEGFDYVNGKNQIDPKYAWKNLKYWWENEHINPSGQKTNWVPKSKKIWFTEFGFPSIDKAPNQPNVFFDPKCRDGGVPKGSKGTTDFSIQRTCLKASLEHFDGSEFLEKAFVWTWDARPYPAWPHSDSWGDGYLWEKGHWLNGKLSGSSLEIVIADLCHRAGIDPKMIEFKNMDQKLGGMIIQGKSSIFNIIQMLRGAYFFDIAANFDTINFVRRGTSIPSALINQKELIKKDPYQLVIDQLASNELIGNIKLSYISDVHNYDLKNISHLENNRDFVSRNAELNLPIIMSESDAKSIANILIKNANYEKEVLNFSLPFHYIHLQAGDIIELIYEERKYLLRILSLQINKTYLDIIAVPEMLEIYHIPSQPESLLEKQLKEAKIVVINQNVGISYQDFIEKKSNTYIVSDIAVDLYVSKDGESFKKTYKKLKEARIAKVVSFMDRSQGVDQIIDDRSEIIISYEKDPDIIAGGFEAQICGEIIYCADVEQLDGDKYKLKRLYRKLYNSRRKDNDFDFVVIDRKVIAAISAEYTDIKVQDQEIDIENHVPEMFVADITSDTENDVTTIRWVTIHPYIDSWAKDAEPIPDQEISYSVRVGDVEYVIDHDHTKATQEFEFRNKGSIEDIEVRII